MSARVARIVCFSIAFVAVLAVWRGPGANPAQAMVDPGSVAQPAPSEAIDLATYGARRWMVQLAEPPIAAYEGGMAGLAPTAIWVTGARRLDLKAPAARAYRRHLEATQRDFRQTLAKAAPGSRVDYSYTITVNGLGVKMSPAQAAAVRRLAGVKAVTPDVPFQLQMFSTPKQIGAPAIWARLGGKANAGRGVKVGIIDGGIFVKTDPANNFDGAACFRDDGFPDVPAGFPKGDARFTNKKVLVARAYFRQDDPPMPGSETPLPGPNGGDTAHGTHVAGTVACAPDTPTTYQGVPIVLDGVAPGAYLFNYKVFYASRTSDGFQNGNAYVLELAKAIEDSIEDGADVISNSWGSSYQNTLAWPDPMVQAAELAMKSGVVAVFAAANAGPTQGTVASVGLAEAVITVGAVTKDAGVSVGDLSATSPAPVPERLARLDVGGAAFGPANLPLWPMLGAQPAPVLPAEKAATNAADTGCLVQGASPYPTGSLDGKVALINGGVCQNSQKVFLAQQAGAVAALVYNATTETLTQMAAQTNAADVTIPSWFMRRSDGLALRDFALAQPTATIGFVARPHLAEMPGDIMAGFSSRGPTQDKLLKPDVVAPGVAVLSNGFAPAGDDPDATYTGFGAVSGTSMATPHVAGASALLVALHPEWQTWQVKAALMATGSEAVYLDNAKTQRAGLLDQGAGRIDLTKAGDPGVFVTPPSISGGELLAGAGRLVTLVVSDAGGQGGTWQASLEGLRPAVAALPLSPVVVPAGGKVEFNVPLVVPADAASGDYEWMLRLQNTATGQQAHVPAWYRVVPPRATDILLLDDDRSGTEPAPADYSGVYSSTLAALGYSIRYVDTQKEDLPAVTDLSRYRAAILFTGDNAGPSGMNGTERNRLTEWLDGGGRILATGQDLANVNGSVNGLSGNRLYKGYLALTVAMTDTFRGAPPNPSASGVGAFAGWTLDLSPGGSGAGNQTSIEATWPMTDTDAFAGTPWTQPIFKPLGRGFENVDYALGYGRSSEPSLEEPRLGIRYRAMSLGFGLEGVNGAAAAANSRQALLKRSVDWMLDAPTYTITTVGSCALRATNLQATGASAVDSPATQSRWDFGDGSPIETVPGSTIATSHAYGSAGNKVVRLEVTNTLGHRYLAQQAVEVTDCGVTKLIHLPLLPRDDPAAPWGGRH
jgi:subtilisin family serine protease